MTTIHDCAAKAELEERKAELADLKKRIIPILWSVWNHDHLDGVSYRTMAAIAAVLEELTGVELEDA